VGPELGMLKWKHKIIHQNTFWSPSSPAIDSNGDVYVGGGDSLHAISQDGDFKWSHAVAQIPPTFFLKSFPIYSSPVIDRENTLYIGAKLLYAFSSEGELNWWYVAGSYIFSSSPVIDENGLLYIGSSDNYLFHAVNPDGTIKWTYKADSAFISSSPAIGVDGTIYVGCEDGRLYAFNPDGTLKWRYKTGSFVSSSPAIDVNGTIYVGSYDNHLYAINPDGSLKWRYETEGYIWSSPAIAEDRTIYVGSQDNHLYAINPDGSLKWRYEMGAWVDSSPAIDGEGNIYVGSDDYYIYSFKPDGTLRWRYLTGDFISSSPAIAEDGTIYITSNDGYLYAIGEATGQECPVSVIAESASWIESFRRYRDEILVSNQEGKKYIDLYYKHAPEISSLLLSHSGLSSQMSKIIGKTVPVVNGLLAKKKAILLPGLLEEVKSFLADLEIYASPSLKKDLKMIEMNTHKRELFKNFGIRTDN
jgi:outer membrane protein assembly factor BamB